MSLVNMKHVSPRRHSFSLGLIDLTFIVGTMLEGIAAAIWLRQEVDIAEIVFGQNDLLSPNPPTPTQRGFVSWVQLSSQAHSSFSAYDICLQGCFQLQPDFGEL